MVLFPRVYVYMIDIGITLFLILEASVGQL